MPSDHLLGCLKEAVDFSFVNDLVRDLYSERMGRPSLPPVLMVKALLLQYFYSISDDALEEGLTGNLFFKYFCDMEWDTRGPDATSLVRFRGRLGPQRFVAIFNRMVEQAAARGLVYDALSVVDLTQVRAKVDMLRVRCRGKRSPDPDSKVEEMSQAVSASIGKSYGLARVAGVWEIARSTVYGRRKRGATPLEARPAPRRRGPKGPCGDGCLNMVNRVSNKSRAVQNL